MVKFLHTLSRYQHGTDSPSNPIIFTEIEPENWLPFHKLFEEQVHKSPNNIALIQAHLVKHGLYTIHSTSSISFPDKKWTYLELNGQANRFAHLFIQRGIKKGDIIAIYLERRLETFAALLGAWKAGAAFLLLDTGYPKERIEFMLKDSGAKIIVSSKRFLANLSDTDQLTKFIIDSSEITEELKRYKARENPNRKVSANDVAYMIYTSGTTGTPKGALIEHIGLHNWSNVQQKRFHLTSKDCILQFAPLSFDPTIWDLIMALRTGGSLYLTSHEVCQDQFLLNQLLQQAPITGMTVTPSIIGWLSAKIPYKALRFVVLTGEAFNLDHREEIKDLQKKGVKVFNGYGPSETTIGTTILEVLPEHLDECMVPIGLPICNTVAIIVQPMEITGGKIEFGKIKFVEEGEEGEIWVISPFLARGYHNRPEETQKRFISIIYKDKNNKEIILRAYRTGDLGRLCRKRGLFCLGRTDNQLKIEGKRIEIEEVKEVIRRSDPHIEKVWVRVWENNGRKSLIAYIKLKPGKSTEKQLVSIKEVVKKKLPCYANPAYYIRLNKFPFSLNGKVDESRLPLPNEQQLERSSGNNKRQYTELEKKVVFIWKEVLSFQGTIDENTDFRYIGGNSLDVNRLHKEYLEKFGVNISVQKLYDNPTFRGHVKLIVNALEEKKKMEEMRKKRPSPSSLEFQIPRYKVKVDGGTLFDFQKAMRNML